jgi:hypothetical protein|eukprot:g810.t1
MEENGGLPQTQFVMINYVGQRRVVTFYKNQPVNELRDLLTALFPDVSSGESIPVGVERPADNLVVPLSAGAKFPQVMTGHWDLLVVPHRELESEKSILREFSKGMYKENFIGERAMKDLLLLVEEEDRPLLAAYRSYRRHKDVGRLKDALIELVKAYRAPLLGGEETRIANKMLSLVRMMLEEGQLSTTQGRVLADLIMAGDSVVFSAYDVAKIDRNIDELRHLLLRIATAKTSPAPTPVAAASVSEDDSETAAAKATERRDIVLRVVSEYDHLSDEEKRALHAPRARKYVDIAVDIYDNGGDVEQLLRSLQEIAKAMILTGTDEATSEDNSRPPRPETPTPYQDEQQAVLERLLTDGHVDESEARSLRQLMDENHELVRAAFEIYKTDGDFQDLRETLVHILNLFGNGAIGENEEDGLDTTVDLSDSEEDEATGSEAPSSQLDRSASSGGNQSAIKSKIRELLDTLVGIGKMSAGEKNMISALVDQTDTKEQDVIISAFDVFETDQDYNDFVDTCKRVLMHLNLKVVEDIQQFDNVIQQLAMEDSVVARWGEHLQQLVLLFRQGDPRVCAAWDVLAESGDVDEFADTMDRILQRLGMEQDFRDAEQGMELGVEAKGDIQKVVDYMFNMGYISMDEAEVLFELMRRNDTIISVAYDTFLTDQLLEDFIGTLKNIAKNASEGALMARQEQAQKEMTELTEALEQTGSLRTSEAERLQTLINENDSRVMAAYDVYYEMQDVYDLMDTVKRLVTNSDSEAEESETDYEKDAFERYESSTVNTEYTDDTFETATTTSSNFANDSAQAVKGWSQGEDSDPTLSVTEYSESESAPSDVAPSDSMDGYSEDFEKVTDDERNSTINQLDEYDNIFMCIHQMHEVGHLTRSEESRLMDYCRTDDRVVAAYDVFLADQNLSDFADTLLRLLDVLEGEKNEVAEAAFEENCRTENQLLEAAKAANDAQEEVEDEMNEAAIAARNAREEIEDEMEEAAAAATAAQEDFNEEIQEVIEAAEAQLRQLERKQERMIEREFEDNKMEVKKRKVTASNKEATLRRHSNAFLEIVNDMNLSSDETMALEHAVLNGNASVRAAMKVFTVNKDVADLKDTLKRVARQAVDEIVVEDIEEPTDFMSVLNRMQQKGMISDFERNAFEDLMRDGNQVVQAAYEVYELDQDESEMADTLRRVANRAGLA